MARKDKERPDFIGDLKIDEHSLEKEWLRQPSRFMEWAERAADADREVKKAEELVKTIRSEIIMKAARGEYSDLSAKPTGQQIEAYYRTDPDYMGAKEALIDAENTRDLLMNATSAFRMRKDALENLVRLHLAGYFGSPRDPEEGYTGKAVEKTLKKAGDKTDRMRSRREKEE